jgi:hypothetical protein
MKTIALSSISLAFVMAASWVCHAQSWSSVRSDIVKELTALKPKNTSRYVYDVRVPIRPRAIPANVRVDIVYKDGHYDFEYVALRFERLEGEPQVKISYFSYGSALAFWREYSKSKKDTYIAKLGTMPVAEFDRLLTRAFAYYDSEIAETYVPPKPVKRNGKWYLGGGMSGSSRSWSSGDGSVVVAVSSGKDSIIRADASLYGDDLKSRMDNGYEEIRATLFWKLFHDRVTTSVLLREIPKANIENLAIARLNEPPQANTYRDYFGQAVFVELLGEFGTAKSLETLKRVSFDSGLDPDWHEHIQRDVSDAVKKISSRR